MSRGITPHRLISISQFSVGKTTYISRIPHLAPRTSDLAPILQHDSDHMIRKLEICMSPRKRMTSTFSSYIDEHCSSSTPSCEPELLSDRLNAQVSRIKDQRSRLNAQGSRIKVQRSRLKAQESTLNAQHHAAERYNPPSSNP
jgi:hypothetical protein